MTLFIHEKLITFGFIKEADSYSFSVNNEKLDLIFTALIDNKEKLTFIVKDALTDEEFRLHLSPKAKGEYVQAVRNEIAKLEASIKDKCSHKDLFQEQWQKIVLYIKDKYNSDLECLWKEKFNSDEGIFRRLDNEKWFAALLICNKKTLTGDGFGKLEIINVRVDPLLIDSIVDNELIFRGYHMNKKSWISIFLNEGCPLQTIYSYIDESFRLVGLTKKSVSKQRNR